MSQGDVFVGAPPSENLYITITNASHQRAIVVTHVWLATDPRVDVLDQALAKRLEYGDVWETWVPMSKIPEGTDELEWLARCLITPDDKIIKSKPRKNVPPVGTVPRG